MRFPQGNAIRKRPIRTSPARDGHLCLPEKPWKGYSMSCGQASSGKLLRKNTEVEAQFIFHHERGCFVRKHLTVVHFSPTGGTRRAALLLAEGPARRIDELDLTLPAPTGRTFGPQDAVLFAGPVFGGRLSALMTQRLKTVPVKVRRPSPPPSMSTVPLRTPCWS